MFMSKFAKGRLSVEPIICYILHAFRIGCCCDYYDWGQCICGLHDRNIKYQIKLFYIGGNKYHIYIIIIIIQKNNNNYDESSYVLISYLFLIS